MKSEGFDPISIGNIGTVGDWVVEADVISDPQKWKDLIQPVVTPYPLISNEDEVEAFISGMFPSLIHTFHITKWCEWHDQGLLAHA
jgi:hypothetical protein